MSDLRKRYFARLGGRIIIAGLVLYLYFVHPETFDILKQWSFFRHFSPLHLLWGIWVADMLAQLLPVQRKIALGSQKAFSIRFHPITQAIHYESLKNYIVTTTKAAYKVFMIWVGVLSVLAALFFTHVIGRNELFLVCVAFYVCDLICVLIWCPFRLIMKNKCCTTCRIFNWDHLMMFSPFMLIPSFYTTSLLILAFAVWVVWEACVMMYPERFYEMANAALQCVNCTDKLCTQYCQKLRKQK